MCKGRISFTNVMVAFISFSMLYGCAKIGGSMLIGGKYVTGYTPSKVLVDYKAEGVFPVGSNFYLIETATGLAFYQQDADGSGIICEKFWHEADSVYFSAAFFGYGPAFIYKVPVDRTQNAGRYVYENGTYQGSPGDRLRPMPNAPKESPDAILIPTKIYDAGFTKSEEGRKSTPTDYENARSERVKELESLLGNSDSSVQRDAAIKLYQSADFRHPDILEIVSKELIKGYNKNISDGHHIDAMAWLCKILGASGNNSYKKTLEEVVENSESNKIKKYAAKSLRGLN